MSTQVWNAGRTAWVAIAAFVCLSAQPVQADTFHACVRTVKGTFRSSTVGVNVPSCKLDKETAVSWNDVGPEGVPGPQGEVGPSDAFATHMEIGAGGPIAVPAVGVPVVVGQLDLPAGNFVVSASLYITNVVLGDGIAYCTLLVGGRNAQVIDTLSGGQAVSQALTVAAGLTAPGPATLYCTNNTSTGDLQLQTFNLNAIRVGNLTFQP
jgi:hypothetical protein